MEKYGENCRFILTANYETQIISPLKSRCATFTLLPIKKEEMVTILKRIAENEHILYNEEALAKIAEVSKGDMRYAINLLQTLSTMQPITPEMVAKKVGDISNLISYLKTSPKLALQEADKLLQTMDEREILNQIFTHYQTLYLSSNLPEDLAKSIFTLIAEADYRMAVGASKYIQLVNLIYEISSILISNNSNDNEVKKGNEGSSLLW